MCKSLLYLYLRCSDASLSVTHVFAHFLFLECKLLIFAFCNHNIEVVGCDLSSLICLSASESSKQVCERGAYHNTDTLSAAKSQAQ